MANFEDLFKTVRLPEDSKEICLRGDLQRRHEDLERELQEAQQADKEDSSLAGGGKARKVAEQIRQVEDEMREYTHPFAFRAMPSREYRELVEQHPPRKGNELDGLYGANMNTFPHAVISECCIDPVMTVEQVEQLCDVITDGQQMDLFMCAAALNRSPVDIPKSELASAILATPVSRPKPRERGGSRGGGSTAGSLAG